jgi:hypothetical protein
MPVTYVTGIFVIGHNPKQIAESGISVTGVFTRSAEYLFYPEVELLLS